MKTCAAALPVAGLLMCGSLLADNVPYKELTAEEKTAIDAVLPKKAPAKPRKARRLLIVHITRNAGKPVGGHPSIPHANYAFIEMGRRTGAFEAVVNNEESVFLPESLKKFDAIVFNNTVGVLFDDPVLRKSLLDFVRDGKGFAGFHAAGATFAQWPRYDFFPEYGEMLGGFEDGGHPWRHTEKTPVKIDDPKHPVNAAFRGQPFEIEDEAFQFREPSIRDRLRVLLSIDVARTDINPKRRILKQRQQDLDFPVSWVKPYGKGRVFYTFMGHQPKVFMDRALLEHFLAGIQFALGDLKADATPSAKARL